MPQRTSRRGTGLSEITEELKECDDDSETELSNNNIVDDDAISNISNEINSEQTTESNQNILLQKNNDIIQLNITDDPLKRFQVS